jgi:hypothetical protein
MKKYPSIFLVSVLCLLGLATVNNAIAIVPVSYGSVFSSDSSNGGNRSWSNPSNAQSSDNNYATASLTSSGDLTRYLKAEGYGFSIPVGATINGIQVNIERKQACAVGSCSSSVTDSEVKLLKGGAVVGNNKASATHWPLTDTFISYGSPSDLWGTTWTVSDINNANFGAVLSAHRSTGGDRNLSVDQISISVFYTLDTTSPVVNITGPANNSWTNNTTPSVNFTISDNVDPTLDYVVYTDGIAGLSGFVGSGGGVGTSIGPFTDGAHTVDVSAVDDALNSATSSIIINVDTVPPVVTPPAEQTFEATGPSTSPILIPATATDDNDSNPIVTPDITSLSLGTTTVTWTATDVSGNTSATTSEVVIVDTTSPEILLNGNNPFDIFVNTDYSSLNPDPDYSASDLVDGDVTSNVTYSGKDFDSGVLGATYTITYNVIDANGNGATTTRTVNVVDTIKPIIYRIGASPITVEGGSTYSDLGATAVDRDGSDITSSIVVVNPVNTSAVGTYTVTYDVTGADLGTTTGSNIADQARRTVNVVDTTAPTITVIGSNPMIIKIGDSYTDPGANSNDNIDTPKVLSGTPASVDTSVFGTTTITYSDTDSSGNTMTTTRTVVVRNLGTNASLASLSVSTGSLSPAFNSGTTEYSVELPYGSTEVPTISGVTEDPFATATTTQATSITSSTVMERTGTIIVTSEDSGAGMVQKTYSVVFSVGPKPVEPSSGGSSGGRRHFDLTPGLGQVLGAQSVNWDSLSAQEKADMLKTLQALLAEIIKTLNELIANGTLK